MNEPTRIDSFLGVHNTLAPERMPPGALLTADNVVISREGVIKSRPAETLVFGGSNISASYGTLDQTAMILIDSGTMYLFDGNSVRVLATGFNSSPVYWCEESSSRIVFVGGGKAGVIEGLSTIRPLLNITSAIVAIAIHEGRLALAIQERDSTFILMSRPYEYDTFEAEEEGFFIPNRVTALASVGGNLLITTLSNLFALTSEDSLVEVTDFGTPLGKSIISSRGVAFVWTNEGLCTFPEFSNLTEATISVPPGMACSANLFEYEGSRYSVVLTDGAGAADNVAVV